MTAVDIAWVERARAGDLQALGALLRAIQPLVFNLAVRMLGHRDDAEDATQEILLQVTTHLGEFRGESAFTTWVYAVASRRLLNERRRPDRRVRVESFEALGAALERGEAYAAATGANEPLTPEEYVDARRTAIACTQAMLMCLDGPRRLAYVLDVIFGLDSPTAARVQGITAAAHRQRVSRARTSVHGFMAARCGLVSATAPCRCTGQARAKRAAEAMGARFDGLEVTDSELDAADAPLRELLAMTEAAAVLRAAPQYAAPQALVDGVLAVIGGSRLLRH